MKTWIHFVGRKYYSRSSFVKEAERHGVTRRISLAQAKRLEFGDTVVLAMIDGKSAVVFGHFTVERILGIKPEGMRAIGENVTLRKISDGGGVVGRGCGSYVAGAVWTIEEDVSLAKMLKLAEEATDGDVGQLMVGGQYWAHSKIRLSSVKKSSRGFRLFDHDSFIDDAIAEEKTMLLEGKRGLVKLKGHYYAKPEDFPATTEHVDREIGEVHDYKRLEELEAERKAKLGPLFEEE